MSSAAATVTEAFTCPNCGATTSFAPGTRSLRCPFCGTTLAVQASSAALPALTAPRYVLPFKLDREQAATRIRDWLGGSFFAPGDLKSRSAIERGQGSYIPFWRFDADADSEWEGEVSETRTRRVQRTVQVDGRSETRWVDEPYTVWHPRSGRHQGRHRAWVCASTGLTQEEADRLMPFPEEAMLTWSMELLAGFSAEEPGIDETGAWEHGEERIREMERDECSRQVERLTRVETRLSNVESAVCYLPVWLFGYTYRSRRYRVLVNGYTGEVIGDRPVSRARVAIVVALVALVVLAIVVVVLLTR